MLIRGFCSISSFTQAIFSGVIVSRDRPELTPFSRGESATLDLTIPPLDGSECRAGLREGDGEVLMDISNGFPKFIANQSVGAKVWILPRAAADRQSDQNLAGKLFYGMLG